MSTITKGEVLDLISTPRRRLVIEFLDEEDGPLDLAELAESIAAEQEQCDVDDLDANMRKRAYIPLYQNHLPKMVEAGVVEMPHGRSGMVAPGPEFVQVQHTMAKVDESFTPPESWPMRVRRLITEFVSASRFLEVPLMSDFHEGYCPRCGGGIKGITTAGPGDHFVSPCGCKIGTLGPHTRDVTTEVRP